MKASVKIERADKKDRKKKNQKKNQQQVKIYEPVY